MAQLFTLDDLRRILREGAGEAEGLAGEIEYVEFEDLGYESLALLETSSRINREYGVLLDDEAVAEATTPHALLSLVNKQLADGARPA
jgi:act minimal PKS acyl carrier protein